MDIKFFTKRLKTCVNASGGHMKHVFAALSSVFDNCFLIFDIITLIYSVMCF